MSNVMFSTHTLTLTDFVRFAGAAGGFNPAHYDPA